MYDAIIVGGSYAGLSAAMQLARARRRLLVVDGGQRRNRFAEHSHGFLSRDGAGAADIAGEAKRQLLLYPTVEWRDATVVSASGTADDFVLTDSTGAKSQARRLLLALGVADELPPIPGLSERWGRNVFHCPYCHGYEIDGPIGVLNVHDNSIHQALMLPDWGPTTFLLNGRQPSAAELETLGARGVALEPAPIEAIVNGADVRLADGRELRFGGLFSASRTRPSSDLAATLGCTMEEGPAGHFVVTDMLKQTTVPGVFACGDVARASGNVALAVGDGAMAGAALHRSLMFGL
jgi:thioredoxin reductase